MCSLPFSTHYRSKIHHKIKHFPDQCPEEIKYLNFCLLSQFQETFIGIGNACLLACSVSVP